MSTETAPLTDAGASTESAPETPWTSQIFAADKPGELIPDWHTKAPDDERGKYEPYKDAKTVHEFVSIAEKRASDAQTALRTKQSKDAGLPVRPEGAAATPEALAAYYTARGLPAEPGGYGIAMPADFPKELWNDAEAAGYAKFFHDQEYTPAQVKELTAFAQQNARQVWAQHQQAMAEQKVAMEKGRADYVQAQKETLHQNHGVNVDTVIKRIEKLAGASGFDTSKLHPDNADTYVGSDVIKLLDSVIQMLPRSGDAMTRMAGNMGAAPGRGKEWARAILKNDHPDNKALRDSRHPNHAEIKRAWDLAYASE